MVYKILLKKQKNLLLNKNNIKHRLPSFNSKLTIVYFFPHILAWFSILQNNFQIAVKYPVHERVLGKKKLFDKYLGEYSGI